MVDVLKVDEDSVLRLKSNVSKVIKKKEKRKERKGQLLASMNVTTFHPTELFQHIKFFWDSISAANITVRPRQS